jgi:D-lactate dehydrogenase
MRVAVFSCKDYERPFLDAACAGSNARDGLGASLILQHLDARLTEATADLARGAPVVSIFVADDASAPVLRRLHDGGTRLLALRSAGFNHVVCSRLIAPTGR